MEYYNVDGKRVKKLFQNIAITSVILFIPTLFFVYFSVSQSYPMIGAVVCTIVFSISLSIDKMFHHATTPKQQIWINIWIAFCMMKIAIFVISGYYMAIILVHYLKLDSDYNLLVLPILTIIFHAANTFIHVRFLIWILDHLKAPRTFTDNTGNNQPEGCQDYSQIYTNRVN